MKRNIRNIFFTIVVFISINTAIYAVYLETYSGKGNLKIAVPQIEIEAEEDNIDLTEDDTYTNQFKVKNYNEKGEISEVNLSYQLCIKTNFEASPLYFKLYQIHENGTEEMELTRDLKSIKTFKFSANQYEEHNFKLEIAYDFSNNDLKENTEVSIEVEAVS